ncbi:LysR family transcriptional regulator [Streptacidiphilus sp. N1-10]|uniref:LysR family transcriptional regulator n=1 Tax=Streptacidiphilus jeojiensis TaxID=3229225 RepID=A0ABV6XYB8_9ACTN
MNELETRQLRYFVAVAEELHFGRAAERLGMAQPPLSRAIRELEHQLGVALLKRTTRQVALTPAGQVLLGDARNVLDAISAAGRRAQHAGEPEPRLRLALKADIDGGLLPQILDAYAQDEAALPVELVLGPFGDQAPALYDGRADTALLLDPVDQHGLDYEPLLTEPFLIALAATDPLAARLSLRLADLAGRSLPDGSPAEEGPAHRSHGRTAVHDQPSDPVRGDTATPGTVQDASDLPQILRLVELSRIVCFLPASVTRRYTRPEVAYLPVDDLAPATLAVAWPQASRSPAVAAFVRAAATVAAAPRETRDITDSTHLTPDIHSGTGSLMGQGHETAP